MKSIVLFINNLGSGGAEHQLVELANGLSQKGYNVTITTYGDVPDHYECKATIKRTHIAKNRNEFIKSLALWHYFVTLDADCIISFCQRQNLICLFSLLFRVFHRIKVIAGERNTTVGKPDKYERLLMKYFYKRADFIVSNSYSQYEHILNLKPSYKEKSVVITNYTDTSIYRQSHLPGKDKFRIVVFGRYAPQKNCLRFVDAIKKLSLQTKKDFVVEWFGDKTFKGNSLNLYYDEMCKKVAEYDLGEYLILNDKINDVPKEMERFDAFCLPSLYEGFSNALSEAISCGKPCLVSNIADNGVMVHDGLNGFLFDPQNIESIVEAFLKLFDMQKDDLQKMGNASRNRATELFDKNKYIQSYINLIEL